MQVLLILKEVQLKMCLDITSSPVKLLKRSMENTFGKELRKIKVTNGNWLKLLKGSMLTI